MGYVFQTEAEREREAARLVALEAVHDPFSIRCLDQLPIADGWRCLEAGAGHGSIMRWLAGRVGPAGKVVATDVDPHRLDELAASSGSNVVVLQHDVSSDDPPDTQFDLIHARFLLAHLDDREAVLRRLVGWLRPGGWIVIEDIDYSALGFVPIQQSELFESVVEAVLRLVVSNSTFDSAFGRRLPGLLRRNGLADIGSEGSTVLIDGNSPQIGYVTEGLHRLRDGLVAHAGLLDAQIAAAVRLCADPTFGVLAPLHIAAWGRRPA
jgi:2-polyprenyl-3-methyl-5-hydroxy-6-metoxy-1,4-benzoquinol methylase